MKCKEENCKKTATFNLPNLKALYCKTHRSVDMIDVRHKTCIENNCNKNPNYNLPNLKPLYCGTHKKSDMVDVAHKKCFEPNCKTRPTYNLPSLNPLYCDKHKKINMVDVSHTACLEQNCKIRPTFNYKNEIIGLYCVNHKLPFMCDVMNKYCIDCGLTQVARNFNQGKCAVCNTGSYRKQKENEVKQLFLDNNLIFVNDKQFPNTCNIKNRPDFLFDCLTFYLIVEVDENGHNSYDTNCDIARTNNIHWCLDLPVKMIRFNCDNKNFTTKHKQEILLNTVIEYLNKKEIDNIEVIKLFY